MTLSPAVRFASAASVAAVVGAATLFPWLSGVDRLASEWAVKGFLAMALPGIASGAWLAHEHGRRRSRFVAALGGGVIVRLGFASILALVAARAGGSACTGLIAGLAAGFVPVTLFEMVWFARSRDAQGMGTETRG